MKKSENKEETKEKKRVTNTPAIVQALLKTAEKKGMKESLRYMPIMMGLKHALKGIENGLLKQTYFLS